MRRKAPGLQAAARTITAAGAGFGTKMMGARASRHPAWLATHAPEGLTLRRRAVNLMERRCLRSIAPAGPRDRLPGSGSDPGFLRPMFHSDKGGDPLANQHAVSNLTRASDRRVG